MVSIEQVAVWNDQPVYSANLTDGDLMVEILSYGAITKQVRLNGRNLVLGYETIETYFTDPFSMGIIAGRVANRINNSEFSLNKQVYTLEANDGLNHLHGASTGFGKLNWQMEKDEQKNAVVLSYLSPHLEGGFPGKVEVKLIVSLIDNCLTYQFTGVLSESGPLNLAQHNYYSLGGELADHTLMVAADSFTPTDSELIPTGKIEKLPADWNFNSPKTLHSVLASGGIDHNFVFSQTRGPNAVLFGNYAKIEIETDQPGLQVYTGTSLSTPFAASQGICLEPQLFPNSVNEPSFPSCIFSPNRPYSQTTKVRIAPV